MKTVVVAIIGCGRIANAAHLPALSNIENVRIKYACDLILSKAEAAKKDFPKVEQVITDYNIALADEEVDAVYVLTPNYAHYTVTMDALRAGKHVFCEKPITVNYKLSKEMADEAEKQGKILNIGVCNRYNRSIELLKQMNDEGKFGKIYHVYCSFRDFRSIPGLGGAFTDKSQAGGGVLIDWGVHYLDLIMYILGIPKIKNVTCDAYCEIAKDMKSYKYRDMWSEDTKDVENGVNDVDDYIAGHIRTDGASISFNGAWAQNLDIHDCYVDFLGDKGGARLTYGKKFIVCNGETLETEAPEYDMCNMFECEDRGFVESVISGEKNRNNITNVIETAKLLDALYVSSDRKAEVTLD